MTTFDPMTAFWLGFLRAYSEPRGVVIPFPQRKAHARRLARIEIERRAAQ
jgi:hypothetical protein